MAVNVQVDGVARLTTKLNKMSQLTTLKETMNTATAMVHGAAKNIVPRDTGALAESIHMTVEQTDTHLQGKVNTSLEYAPYVEFGTGMRGSASDYPQSAKLGLAYGKRAGQVAQPYLYPALQQNKDKIKKLFAEAVKTSAKG